MVESNTEDYQYQTHIKNAVVMQELETDPTRFESTQINQEVDRVYEIAKNYSHKVEEVEKSYQVREEEINNYKHKANVYDKISEIFDGKYELSDFNTEDIKLIKGYIKDVDN